MPNSSNLKISWPDILHQARTRFHIKRLRPGQREVIDSVLHGRNTLAIMPTGAGKSLTYQLPALFLPHPVVVVSPLIALMQDQQQKAHAADIAVEKLDSTLHVAEAREAEHEIEDGIARLIYCTPERLQQDDFLAQLQSAGGISLLVVDEAHTIPQWGHDFRPAFLSIGEARKRLGNPPILALTATATDEITAEILKNLHAEDAMQIHTGIERENLFFAVFPTVNNEAKLARVLAMVADEPGSGIVYTASVRSANQLYDYLKDRDVSVARYHGRMTARQRTESQTQFMGGAVKVMVATKAFGLGVDKPDIRFVYHYEFPDSLESYYQEAGRAGRDAERATAALFYRLEDKRIQSLFLAGRYPRLEELRAVIQTLLPKDPSSESLSFSPEADAPASPLPSKRRTEVILHLLREANLIRKSAATHVLTGDPPADEALEHLLQEYVDRAARDKERLAEMMHYAETPDCRVQIIRRYFDQAAAEACGHCDNCLHHQDEDSTRTRTETEIQAQTRPQSTGEQITEVATAYGTIRTTAPETLPQPTSAAAEPSFHPGDRVHHKRFGEGKVLDTHDNIVLVSFPNEGQKRLRADYLNAAFQPCHH